MASDNPLNRFAFVDAVIAAEALRVTPEQVLDWIAAGRLRSFGGKPGNPFLRSADVAALAEELGVAAEPEPPKRVKSASSRVQTRLTADSRWVDIGEDDIREWANRADSARRQAARKVAAEARQRLEIVLRMLDELEP